MKQDSLNLSVFWVRTSGALQRLEPEWMDLFNRMECQNVFLSFDWMASWWSCCGKDQKLFVLAVRNGTGRLVGVGPFYISDWRSSRIGARKLRFLADDRVGSDYLNVLVEEGSESPAIRVMVDFILKRHDLWNYIQLQNCEIECQVFSELVDQLRRKGLNEVDSKSSVCPYISLPQTFESFMSGLSSNVRYNFQRRLNSLRKNGHLTFRVLTDPREISDRFGELVRLHRLRFEQKNRKSTFLEPSVQDFCAEVLKTLTKRRWVRLNLLEMDGSVVAALCNFSVGNKIQFYQSGMDPSWSRFSPGFVLMGLSIENAIRDGFVEFDFLQGAEPYKFKWTKNKRQTYTVRLADECWKGQLALTAERVVKKTASVKKLIVNMKRKQAHKLRNEPRRIATK